LPLINADQHRSERTKRSVQICVHPRKSAGSFFLAVKTIYCIW
jgi:hypothetical protein